MSDLRDKGSLRLAQQAIITEMYERDALLVVMRMGGGKTASALTAFAEQKADGVRDVALVAVPPSVLLQGVWRREAARWAHLRDLRVVDLLGRPAARSALLAAPGDVYVVSHNNLVKTLAEWPHDMRRTVLVFDEFSRLRGPKSATAEGILSHGSNLGAVWGLTGTPRPGGYIDVYTPYKVLSKGTIWGGQTFWDWRAQNFMPLDPKWRKCRIHPFQQQRIDAVIAPYTVVVDTSALDASLPPLNSGPDYDIVTELSPEARTAYRQMVKSLVTVVAGKTVLAGSRAVAQSKLEQIVQGFVYDEKGEPTGWSSPTKAQRLAEVLDEIGDEPTLICYWFREDLTALRAALGRGLPYIGGGVPSAVKAKHIDDWNAGRLPRLAVHPQSIGHGVEMQHGGRRMIWYCPTWSPELYAQTVKRLLRPGQDKPVFVHRMLAAKTVDLVKIDRCDGKIVDEQAFIDNLLNWVHT